jgi:hypothetical protein
MAQISTLKYLQLWLKQLAFPERRRIVSPTPDRPSARQLRGSCATAAQGGGAGGTCTQWGDRGGDRGGAGGPARVDGACGNRADVTRSAAPLGRRPIPHPGNADLQAPSLPHSLQVYTHSQVLLQGSLSSTDCWNLVLYSSKEWCCNPLYKYVDSKLCDLL